jgi:hypothetical protein
LMVPCLVCGAEREVFFGFLASTALRCNDPYLRESDKFPRWVRQHGAAYWAAKHTLP